MIVLVDELASHAGTDVSARVLRKLGLWVPLLCDPQKLRCCDSNCL